MGSDIPRDQEITWRSPGRNARNLHAVLPGSDRTLCQPYLRRKFIEREGLPHCVRCEAFLHHRAKNDEARTSPFVAFAIYVGGQRPLVRDERVPVFWVRSTAEEEAKTLRNSGHSRAEVRPVLLSVLPTR